MGRRTLIAGGAGLGLAATGALTASAQDAATPAAGGESDLDQLKADVRAAYDKTRSDLETLGGDVSADTRAAFDELTTGFEAIGTELTKAEELPHDAAHQVKRAYRDIAHALEELDDRTDLVLHLPLHAHDNKAGGSGGGDGNGGGQVAADVKETWHGVREALHHVHRSIDHVIDAL
jgi:enamine deaminase RidA (YjgF/YER057c/UK114 family)